MRFHRTLLLAAAALAVSGCATKSYVNDSVASASSSQKAYTDQAVSGLAASQKATDARQDAEIARQGAQLGQLDKTSREALQRAQAAGKLAEGKFLYDVVLKDDAVKFASGRSKLSADGEAQLVSLVNQLKSQNGNVYLEIQGYTDSTGSAAANQKLGLARAEAVRLFLYKQGVPLVRMATISYGEDSPVASNRTRKGRAANRRVVIVVLK
jgi:outer membrane protein OmpA-like peptidoglycan-associated protein